MLNKYNVKLAAFALAIGGLFAAPVVSKAGVETSGKESKPVVETVKEPFVTGDIGDAVVSEYISRGVVNENQGFIDQPYLDIYFQLYKGDGFVNKVSGVLSLWSSIQGYHKDTATPGVKGFYGGHLASWYEFDWDPGIAITFAKNFTLTISWFEFDFVSSGGRSGNLNMNLALDDSEWLGAFALHPHVTVLKSMIGNPNGVLGANNGWYYEVGIAPGYTFMKKEAYPVTFTLPLTVGLGDKKFYGGQTYGYFAAGANVSVPLAFIPAAYGPWTVSTGATYYNLGSNAAAASVPGITRFDRTQWVFSGALGLTF